MRISVTNENKVTNFTPGSLENKFFAETNTNEMKDVNSTFPQPAAVTLYIIRFEKQQVLSNQIRISGGNQ